MANAPTAPASLASRLTDEEILEEAAWTSRMGHRGTAAVLRDYVRLRKLAKAVREVIDGKDEVDAQVKDGFVVTAVGAVEQIRRLLAEAEKGEAE